MEECKLADPEGIYIVECEDMNYTVELPSDVDSKIRAKMFKRLHVMPSAAKQFWMSSRKILSADAAHLKGPLQHVVNMLTIKDANDQNLTLMYTICATESEDNWYSTMKIAAEELGNDAVMFISDRAKGLLSAELRLQVNSLWKPCIFVACALHIAR